MKIALFAQCMYPPWIEGIKNNSLLLSRELSKQIDLEIISHKPKEIINDKNIEGLKINYLLNLSDNKFIQLLYFFLGAFRSLFFVYKKQIRIISIQYFETSFILPIIFILLFKWNTKFILTLYSTDELNIFYKKFIFKILKFKIKKVIIISEYIRKQVTDLGYKNENTEYIPLSFDKDRYLRLADFNKKDRKTILFSAGIAKEAGSFFMVDVAEIMPDYKFIFAMRKFNKKSEDEIHLLYEYIQSKNISNIEIRRNIEKMEDLLGEVGCLVLPLLDINIKMLVPVALLEAMARGSICFVSDLPNLKILVSDKENAIIFDKNNIHDLRNKIIKFINNGDIAYNAHIFGSRFPDYHTIASQYISLIKSL